METYREWAPTVLGFSAFRLGSRADAEDVTAETFARLLEKGQGLPAARRGPWLMTVARNLCTDRQRRTGREVPLDTRPEPSIDADPIWLDERVRSALSRLSAAQAQIVYLRVIRDLAFAEIGRLTHRSEASARVTYGRAIKHVRHSLEEVEACRNQEALET